MAILYHIYEVVSGGVGAWVSWSSELELESGGYSVSANYKRRQFHSPTPTLLSNLSFAPTVVQIFAAFAFFAAKIFYTFYMFYTANS